MGYPDPDPVEKTFTVEDGVIYHARNCADPIGRYACDCGAADLTAAEREELFAKEKARKEAG